MLVNEDSSPWEGSLLLPRENGPCFLYDAWENRCEEIRVISEKNVCDRDPISGCSDANDFIHEENAVLTEKPAGVSINLRLEPLKSCFLVFGDCSSPMYLLPETECEIPFSAWTRSVCEGSDYPDFSQEKEVALPDRLAEEQPEFSGFVRYETHFMLDRAMKLYLLIEDAKEGVEVFLNGKSAGIQIAPPFHYDLTGQEGDNTLVIEVATTLERQCYPLLEGYLKMLAKLPVNGSGLTGEVHLYTVYYKRSSKMKYYCNPLNLPYRYQFVKRGFGGQFEPDFHIYREAADPSLVIFKGSYFLFPSMTAGFFTSSDLNTWELHEFVGEMPVFDYAPDVRPIGDYLYFCASKRGTPCSFYRCQNPLSEPFEEIPGIFDFWDPALFSDDDGRLYFYWGCTNTDPIYGVELNPETMTPLSDPKPLFFYNIEERGYERVGNDHMPPKSAEQIAAMVEMMLARTKQNTNTASIAEKTDEELRHYIEIMFGNYPYIEGPWMTKYQGKYYLQYAITGTQYNVYGDGVYVSDAPLGPFVPAKNNPYSYKPGGFMNGAGHGSTLIDQQSKVWHVSTMQISHNHDFERRLGLWKAGFDENGELYCDQRYGDWPTSMEGKPFEKPEWMLLSYKKPAVVSSGIHPEAITDENCHTWWKSGSNSNAWTQIDLGKSMDVRAIQINFMDDDVKTDDPDPRKVHVGMTETRYIDMHRSYTRWLMEGSLDGKHYFTIEDKREAKTDLPHDLIVIEEGLQTRYLKLTVLSLPYGEEICVSGIRVFGLSKGNTPGQVTHLEMDRLTDLDILIRWQDKQAVGYNVLWGYAPDKLYHSYMVYDKTEQRIGALIKGQPLFFRVDAFNECGITEGIVQEAH